MTKILTSHQNLKIKQLVALKDRRDRDETGLFLIEGFREIKRAADGGIKFHSLFVCPELFLGMNERPLMQQIGGEIYVVPEPIFKKISYRDRPDGLIAIAYQMGKTLADLSPKKNPLYVVAEAIEKPGNLGTILRSADAVGADGVIVCDRCTDIYNPNVVRASVGTLFTVPVVEAKGVEVLAWLREQKIEVVATSPDAQLNFTQAKLAGPLAIVVGTEQIGLSEFWMNAADIQVNIPMKGVADSLNVAMATTVLLYEALKQR